MTDDDSFLARWARRKQEAAAEAKRGQEAPPSAPPARADAAPAQDERAAAAQQASAPQPDAPEPFDLSTLPPIDSISAVSDVRDFLRAGVPAELTRAALRRAWSADPAIRDFVGLSENAWDFTAPDSIPGFGPLESTEDIRQLVDRIVGGAREAVAAGEGAAELPNNQAVTPTSAQPEGASADAPERAEAPPPQPASAACDLEMEQDAGNHAAGDASSSGQIAEPPLRRTRGAALPR